MIWLFPKELYVANHIEATGVSGMGASALSQQRRELTERTAGLEQESHGLEEVKSELSAINSKLRALDYGISSDTATIQKGLKSLKDQANMTLHYSTHIDEIHAATARLDQQFELLEARLERIEKRQNKPVTLKKRNEPEWMAPEWLLLFVFLQLTMTLALFFR